MPVDNTERSVKEEVRDLDGILPESVDRRTFFKASVGMLAGVGLAGCSEQGDGDGGTGQGGGDDGGGGGTTTGSNGTPAEDGSDSSDFIRKSGVTWRQPWKAEPTWAAAFVAQHEGYWTDAGITAPVVYEGFGGNDTSRRVGTGVEEMGHASMSDTLLGLAEGYDLTIFGVSKQRSILGFIWRTDMMDGPQDLPGNDVILYQAFGESTWPIYLDLVGVDSSEVNTQYSDGADIAGRLAQGEAAAVWGAADGLGAYQQQIDAELDIDPLYKHQPTPGYPMFVNGAWIEDEPDSIEYLARVLEGYSHAAKWVLLNPEEAVQFLRQDVNQALQATEMDQLLEFMRSNVAITVSEEVKDNGIGYVNPSTIGNAIDIFGEALLDDPSSVPGVDELVDTEPQESADLPSFSNDEWSQLEEFSGMWWDIYA